MTEVLRPDICVIGAGAAGLSVAAGAARLGADVVLFEEARMGGDCLNYGCVPSKALLAAAETAHAMAGAAAFGVTAEGANVDWAGVRRHVAQVIAAIAPHDSEERFTGLGVRVVRARAQFVSDDTVEGGGLRVRARRFVVATGSRPLIPPVEGLPETDFLTNETIFSLEERPEHLIVLGGGPIGAEMAQAHRRLGSRVTVLSDSLLLPRDDRDAAAVVAARLRAEGIDLREETPVVSVMGGAGGVAATLADGTRIEGSHLLVAAGRQAGVDGLNLQAAGVRHSAKGIEVDRRLKTANRRIFAIGDAANVLGLGPMRFTHVASHHASVVLRQALFRLPARVETRAVPWVTFTDPELAHVGLSEATASALAKPVRVLRGDFAGNDRARTARQTDGLVKVVATPSGRVLGATIVGPHAGELILPWVLAVKKGLRLGVLSGLIVPYPTLSEVNKNVADSFFVPKLTSSTVRRLTRLLASFG